MIPADEIVEAFLVETHEALEQLSADLVTLEQAPDSAEPLARALRSLHSIKGSSAALSYAGLERLTHLAESLLCRLRDSALPATPAITGVLLEVVDGIGVALARIRVSGSEGEHDHASLVARLTDLLEPPGRQERGRTRRRDVEVVITSPPGLLRPVAPAPLGRMLVDGGAARPDDVTLAVMEQREGDPRPLGQILVDHGSTTPGQVTQALERQAEGARVSVARSVRVDAHVLDALVGLVGRLEQTCADIAAHVDARSPELHDAVSRLDQVTGELRLGATALRMQPIDTVWATLTRVVRDVGVSCGKRVRLEVEGGGTSLDRSILEAVKDPLVQCVRNAVDHGIEAADQRVAADKPTTGRVLLRAFEQGGDVVIEVCDDGRGIDLDRLRSTAVALGVRSPGELAAMSDDDVVGLVFVAGLSTAPAVTRVSGRGVGMDLAKTNVERVGGRIDVRTTHGAGTTFRLTLPSSAGTGA